MLLSTIKLISSLWNEQANIGHMIFYLLLNLHSYRPSQPTKNRNILFHLQNPIIVSRFSLHLTHTSFLYSFSRIQTIFLIFFLVQSNIVSEKQLSHTYQSTWCIVSNHKDTHQSSYLIKIPLDLDFSVLPTWQYDRTNC